MVLARCLVATSVFMASCAATTLESVVSHARIIAAAEQAARTEGLDVDHMCVRFSPSNYDWNAWQGEVDLLGGLEPRLRWALQTTPYWAVYFAPDDHDTCGGDEFVFLARSDLRVLGFVGGE